MEESQEILQLANAPGIVTMLLSMFFYVEPLMRSKGISMPFPLIVQVDGTESAGDMKRLFRDMGAAVDSSVSGTRNDQCMVLSVSRNCKAGIVGALAKRETALVIIVAGVVPSYVPDDCVIQLNGRIPNGKMEGLAAEFSSFKAYANQNPKIVLRTMEIFKTSNWYVNNRFASPLAISIHAALEVYHICYRGTHCEADTDAWLGLLKEVAARIIRQAEGRGYDIVQPIRMLVTGYIEAHQEISICDIEEVDRQAAKALARAQAVLFDNKYYYFPVKLFDAICRPLLSTVSILEVKGKLMEEGILCCNDKTARTFTVKKQFVTTYGEIIRPRFLKILRSFIIEDGTLMLEERRGANASGGG